MTCENVTSRDKRDCASVIKLRTLSDYDGFSEWAQFNHMSSYKQQSFPEGGVTMEEWSAGPVRCCRGRWRNRAMSH